MLSVFLSQHPDDRETGYINALDAGEMGSVLIFGSSHCFLCFCLSSAESAPRYYLLNRETGYSYYSSYVGETTDGASRTLLDNILMSIELLACFKFKSTLPPPHCFAMSLAYLESRTITREIQMAMI